MTPGVVGTALAAVAAGSLVLFSLVLQESAFNPSSTNGLKALTPAERGGQKIIVEAAPEENDSAGGEVTVAESPGSEETSAPTTGTESFSPIQEDDDIVASADDPPVGEFPNASGGTGNTVNGTGIGATANARGPQATISKDPNGRPGGVTLPDRNGPKNTAPPHGPNPTGETTTRTTEPTVISPEMTGKGPGPMTDRRTIDRRPGPRTEGRTTARRPGRKPRGPRTTVPGTSQAGTRTRSSRDKPRNDGKSNDNERRRRRNRQSTATATTIPTAATARTTSPRTVTTGTTRAGTQMMMTTTDDDDDDDDRHDDSHHSNDDSRGHSGSRDSKH